MTKPQLFLTYTDDIGLGMEVYLSYAVDAVVVWYEAEIERLRAKLEQVVKTAGASDSQRNYSAAGHLSAVCAAREGLEDSPDEPEKTWQTSV